MLPAFDALLLPGRALGLTAQPWQAVSAIASAFPIIRTGCSVLGPGQRDRAAAGQGQMRHFRSNPPSPGSTYECAVRADNRGEYRGGQIFGEWKPHGTEAVVDQGLAPVRCGSHLRRR